MAPFPDEVDVFTAPHWRMKQLVGLYCDKVTGLRAARGLGLAVPGRPGLRRAPPPGSCQPRAPAPLRPARGPLRAAASARAYGTREAPGSAPSGGPRPSGTPLGRGPGASQAARGPPAPFGPWAARGPPGVCLRTPSCAARFFHARPPLFVSPS